MCQNRYGDTTLHADATVRAITGPYSPLEAMPKWNSAKAHRYASGAIDTRYKDGTPRLRGRAGGEHLTFPLPGPGRRTGAVFVLNKRGGA